MLSTQSHFTWIGKVAFSVEFTCYAAVEMKISVALRLRNLLKTAVFIQG